MKTREQQIQNQAELSFNGKTEQATIFAQGARWADHNGQHLFVLLGQVETDNEELKGLWVNISGKYFTSRKQAEKYAEQNNTFYRKGQYNIVEIEPYIAFDDDMTLTRKSARPIE